MAMGSCPEDIKKQEYLRKDIYIICYAISRLIRKPKKCLRADFRVASCQPVISQNSICLLKFNFKRTRTRCKTCSELKIEIANWLGSAVFIVNFEHISHLVPLFFLLTLNILIPTRNVLKLLNARLILRRCLCFLMGLMAQNHKTNYISYSGKISLCSFYHCQSLLMKKLSWCHMVLHIIIPVPCILKEPINFSMKCRILSALCSLWLTSVVNSLIQPLLVSQTDHLRHPAFHHSCSPTFYSKRLTYLS